MRSEAIGKVIREMAIKTSTPVERPAFARCKGALL